MGTINKEVFIPKLQMDYLDDPQHLYQITNENARTFIDESLLVLMSKNCCTDSIRSQSKDGRNSSSHSSIETEQSGSFSDHKNAQIKSESKDSKSTIHSTFLDRARLPMSPRDHLSANSALISPRFQQFKSRLNQTAHQPIQSTFMNGNYVRSPASASSARNPQSFVNNPTASQRRQPPNNNYFDLYDTDNFFESPRNFPASGRQSVPAGFRGGELTADNLQANEGNDTSSGYSTASSVAPSSSTYWTRKSDNDSEFVPIKEEEESSQDSDTNTFGGSVNKPAWRQNKSKFFDPPSINDLLNTYDQFDPAPLLQRAVAASERVAQYVNDSPRFRRPQTALADPYISRPTVTQRRGSTPSEIVDLNDFPSTNRGNPYSIRQRYPNGPTANPQPNDYTPRPTHRTVSLPQNNQWLSVSVNPTVDTSALDSVLHSPGRGSEPPHLQRTQEDSIQGGRLENEDYYSDDPMAKTTSNWKNSFANMRERFGGNADFSDAEDDPLFRGVFATDGSMGMPRNGGQRGSFLSKSASQNTIDRRPNDRASILDSAVKRRANEAPEQRFQGGEDDRPRARLGDFWLETVRNRLDTPSTFQRAFSPRLTAAERLEQLHEPIDGVDSAPIQEHLVYRRPSAPDNVAQRRAQYLKEMFRSQSPSVTPSANASNRGTPVPSDTASNYSAATTNSNRLGPNFAPLDSAVAEINRGCGRFPTTNELKYTTTTNNPDGSKTRSYFGQATYNGGDGNVLVSTSRSTTQHSPSPDTLSDTSQQSLIFLPHPRPKHNLRDQLMNAGVGSSFFGGGFPGRRLLTNGPFSTTLSSSSPNFPATNHVSSRISALEKRPGAPNLLQLACVLTGGNNDPSSPMSSGPMSPRSTVFRTKPVIHVDYGESADEVVKRDDTNVFRFPTGPNLQSNVRFLNSFAN